MVPSTSISNLFYAKKYIYIGKIRKFVSVSVLFSEFNNRCLTVAILTLSDKHLIETDLLKTGFSSFPCTFDRCLKPVLIWFSNPIMEGTSTVLSIWKEKCDHSPEIRTFKALSLSTSFEKLESNLKKKKKKNPYLPTLILKTM